MATASSGSDAFAVDLAAMTYFDHLYDPSGVIYCIHHAVVALADPKPTLGTRKLLTIPRGRFSCKFHNSSNDPLAIPSWR